MALIAPSMLSADFLHLEKDVEFVNNHADIFHLDIMDGSFVPNISYGFPIVEAIAKKAVKPLDAHLMIVNPEKYIERFAEVGVNMLSVHLEALDAPRRAIDMIRDCGMKAGLAINPDVPVNALAPYLKDLDFVLIMSVFAGFGGQKFIEETYERVHDLRVLINKQGLECLIEVDGGVSGENAAKLIEASVDILVAGSAIFNAPSPKEAIESLRL